MDIKHERKSNNVSRSNIAQKERCSANEMTIVFSFRYLSEKVEYNFRFFNKKKKNSETSNAIALLVEKLQELSQQTWEQVYAKNKKSGYEYIPVEEFEASFINSLKIPLSSDDKLISIRFNGQNSRFIMKRGTKCRRVAQILGIDYDAKLYSHN